MLKFKVCFVFLVLLLPKLVYATFPDISGTYSGTLSGTDVSGSPPGCSSDGPFTGTLTITLTGNNLGQITGGSGTFANNDGTVDSLNNIGGFNDNTTFSINFTSSGDPGSVTGTFNSTSITITGGSVVDGICDAINLSGTLTKVSGGTTIITSETPSSNLTEAVLFNTQIQNAVTGISNRVTGALNALRNFITPRFTDNQFKMQGAMGLNAGDGIEVPYGVWGNYSYTNYENDFSSTAFDGSSHSFLGGMDFNIWKNTVLGVAVGYDLGDIDTGFNQGNQDTETYTFAPYFGWVMSDVLSMDFNIGYSYVDYDQYRTTGGTRVSSTPSADRWFGAVNLNAITFVDNWILGGRMGLLYARSTIDQYSESNGATVAESAIRTGTLSVAGDIAYSFKEWEPFINVSYQYDYSLQRVVAAPQPSNDSNDILLTTGVRYFEKSGISGNLEYSKRLLRDNYDEDRVSLTVRVDY